MTKDRKWHDGVFFLRDIAEALKLDRPIRACTITISVDELPKASIEFHIADVDHQRNVAKVLEKYRVGVTSDTNELPKEWTEEGESREELSQIRSLILATFGANGSEYRTTRIPSHCDSVLSMVVHIINELLRRSKST
jgi:hypothetical protein